jgi:ABC-type nitrate/sulfonate/bicarbonate transport system ATPase subunit
MIQLKNISKSYSDEFGYKTNLLKNISFDIPEGKICSIIAPTGSGKSSLLKIIASLENQTEGEITNRENYKLFYIPSEPSSFPWLNVKENILFEIDNPDVSKFNEAVKLVGLEGYETHVPNNKSLGFRLRIMLGRAIVRSASLIVVDEPFTKMDEETKSEMYKLIREINLSNKISFLLATTNISEALFLSNNILLMKKNPGEIFAGIEVKLSDNRDIDIFTSSEFIQLRTDIENSFKKIDTQKLFNISI